MEHLVDHFGQIHSYGSLIWGETKGLGVKAISDVLQSDRELVVVDREDHVLEGGRGLNSCNRCVLCGCNFLNFWCIEDVRSGFGEIVLEGVQGLQRLIYSELDCSLLGDLLLPALS